MGYGKWEATTYLGPRFAGQVIEKLKNCLTKVPFFYKRNFFSIVFLNVASFYGLLMLSKLFIKAKLQ